VTNETESIYVDAVGNDSMNGSGPVSVAVTLEGLTADEGAGNGTVLNETTLSVAAGATESVDVTLSDSDRRTYDTVHVLVSTSTGDESLIDRLRRLGLARRDCGRCRWRARWGRRLDRHGRASRSSRCDRRGAGKGKIYDHNNQTRIDANLCAALAVPTRRLRCWCRRTRVARSRPMPL